MIPLFVSNPEFMAKVRVITVKEQLERTVKTLHKAGILHIEISEELEEVDRTALEKERYTVSDLLTRVDDVLVHIKTPMPNPSLVWIWHRCLACLPGYYHCRYSRKLSYRSAIASHRHLLLLHLTSTIDTGRFFSERPPPAIQEHALT